MENMQFMGDLSVGDTVAVLVGRFDPPTMEHVRAIDALSSYSGVGHVWICPLSGKNDAHVRNMSSMLCSDFAANGKHVSYCTAALDKSISDPKLALAWIRERFAYLNFRMASTNPDYGIDTEKTFYIAFGPGAVTPAGSIGIVLENYLPVPADIEARIRAGQDESRAIVAPIWRYIQKHRLYR